MARIALVDATAATEAAVRAALGDDAVACCRPGAVPADAALAIVETAGEAPRDLPARVPVLLIVEPGARLAGEASRTVEKPINPKLLRRQVRAILDGGPAAVPPLAEHWLEPPRIAASAAAALATARRLGGAVWIVGETGTGPAQVVAALARREGLEPTVWTGAQAAVSGWRAVWIPDVERRTAGDQHALEQFLALEPQTPVFVTSSCDPEAAIEAGFLTPALYALLARSSLRLPPLRERRAEIATLASEILAGPAARLGLERATLAPDAMRLLEAYDWPGNVLELEAVLTRSLAARATSNDTAVELAATDLRFAPAHIAPLGAGGAADPAEAAPARDEAPRRAVVVPLADAARRSSDAASMTGTQVAANAQDPAGLLRAKNEAGVEALLAAFAHEIRNPMSTIKTFASLEAARAGDDTRELAGLALEASARIDEQLELLQRYAELAPAGAARLDLVEVLAEAADAAGLEQEIAARRPVRATADPGLARFVADALVAELRARSAGGGRPPIVDAASGIASAVTITCAGGGAQAAVDRLDRWVEGRALPWRLALARAAARRAGGDLDVDVEDGELRLAWRASSSSGVSGDEESEVRKHDEQAGSPDRRRRSRGS